MFITLSLDKTNVNFLGENLSVLVLNFVVPLPSRWKIHKCTLNFQIGEESATQRWMKMFYFQTSCFNNVPSQMACKSVFDAFRTKMFMISYHQYGQEEV